MGTYSQLFVSSFVVIVSYLYVSLIHSHELHACHTHTHIRTQADEVRWKRICADTINSIICQMEKCACNGMRLTEILHSTTATNFRAIVQFKHSANVYMLKCTNVQPKNKNNRYNDSSKTRRVLLFPRFFFFLIYCRIINKWF